PDSTKKISTPIAPNGRYSGAAIVPAEKCLVMRSECQTSTSVAATARTQPVSASRSTFGTRAAVAAVVAASTAALERRFRPEFVAHRAVLALGSGAVYGAVVHAGAAEAGVRPGEPGIRGARQG